MIENALYIEELKTVTDAPIPWNKLDGAKVLITGANGLIASFLVDCLIHRNETRGSNISVFALCRNKEKAEKRFKGCRKNQNFHLVVQNVCEPLNLNINFDYIVHAASNAHPLAFSAEPVETIEANVLGSMNLLEYAKKHDVRRFLFVSSGEIYGQNNSDRHNPLIETDCGHIDPTDPRASYPESKRLSETLCAAYQKEYGVSTVIARPCHIYGPTMSVDNFRADAQFIRKALKKEDIILKSAGTQLRSYCYVADAVRAMLYILLLGESGEAYNIANKNCTVTIRAFAETLAKIAGVRVVFENPDDVEKAGYSKVNNAVLNAAKLERLGWKAQVDLENGLTKTVNILSDKDR